MRSRQNRVGFRPLVGIMTLRLYRVYIYGGRVFVISMYRAASVCVTFDVHTDSQINTRISRTSLFTYLCVSLLLRMFSIFVMGASRRGLAVLRRGWSHVSHLINRRRICKTNFIYFIAKYFMVQQFVLSSI